jgi:hypothetical protein
VANKWFGVGAAIVAVGMLVVGTLSPHWIHGDSFGIETDIGLHEVEICQVIQPLTDQPGVRSCETVSHDAIADGQFVPPGFGRFSAVAQTTFVVGLIAAALLLLCAALAALGRALDLPVQPTSLAILATFAGVVLAAITVALNPFTGGGYGTSYGFVLMSGGASLGLLAAIILGRSRPRDLDDF